MPKRKFTATLSKDDKTSGCGIELPFNPADIFGKVRAPVRITINGHTFRTTIFSMKGGFWFPVNRQNREEAGIAPGERIAVQIEEDREPREIQLPADLMQKLKKKTALYERWQKLSYTHQKEYVNYIEEAKKPETRARRIAKTIELLEHGSTGKS